MSWAKKNERRCDLIHKEVYGTLDAEEVSELATLQELAEERMRTVGGLSEDIAGLERWCRERGLDPDAEGK
jgi:hypothetical protein